MEETGQTVQETPKVQAEQTGENGKNVGMPECETMELIMESRSENEEFARVVAAVLQAAWIRRWRNWTISRPPSQRQ